MTDAERQEALAEVQGDKELHDLDQNQKFNLESLGAGGYAAANSALFSIPDVIVKAVSSDAYRKLQDLKNRNKTASTVGSVAGMFAPTGGLLAKGVGLGLKGLAGGARLLSAGSKLAKGLDTASDIARAGGAIISGEKKLAGVGGGLLQGALAAGEQAIPRVVTGNETLGEAAIGTALGAGIGGVSRIIPSVLGSMGLKNKGESFIKPLEEKLIDKELAARGLSGRDIKMSINKTAKELGLDRTGNAVNNAESVKKSVLDLLKKNNILNADEAQAFIQGTGKKFEELGAKFDASGIKASDLKDKILKNPDVERFLRRHGEKGTQYMDDLISELDNSANLNEMKRILTTETKISNKSPGRLETDAGNVSHAIRDELDDALLSLDPDYSEYKADWRALQPLRYMVARDKMSITPMAKQGSDTAAKMTASALLGGGMAAPAVMKDFDAEDPETWTPAAMKLVAGLVIGGGLNKVVPGVSNYVIGKAAGALNNPKFLSALEQAGIAIEKANIPLALEKFAGIATAQDHTIPEEAKSEIKKTEEAEAVTEPEASAEAVSAVNEKYASKIQKNLVRYWETHYADQGVTFEQFAANVASVTDNFDPKKSYKILFTDKKDQDKYLRDYNIALRIKDIDVSKAYSENKDAGGVLGIRGMLDPGAVALKKRGYNTLVDTVSELVTSPGSLPSASAKKQIEADFSGIMKLPITGEEKNKEFMALLQNKYNLGVDTLTELGLI